jgi:hypothetical protein
LQALAPRSSRLDRRAVAALALVTLAIALAATPALATSIGQTIVYKCAHGESFSGYTPSDYREALKDMSTGAAEYTDCANLIRKAELAAAGGGTGGEAASASSRVALPLSPKEQRAVQSAHRRGSTPVAVGSGKPVRPGVVRASVASALNTLPHSLFAVLALLLAVAAALAAGEVRKRVRARRDA